jgi:hypothetical protein
MQPVSLIKYLPPFLREVLELIQLTNSEDRVFNMMWDEVDKALNNFYIDTLDEYGCSRWESMLDINILGTDTLQDRRFRIKTRINMELPYTYKRLIEMLNTLCGSDGYAIDLSEYSLKVRLELTAKKQFDSVVELLNNVVPANIKLTVDLRYNQYKLLARYTHRQLANFTHNAIRNEVLTVG